MLKELLTSATRPREMAALFKVKFVHSVPAPEEPLDHLAKVLHDREFCYAALVKVSRSFSAVIQQLPQELRDPVCIFYLVLRGLDSVEDDMTTDEEERLELLRSFSQKCYDAEWNIKGVGDSFDYRVLLENFDKVNRVFLSLPKDSRDIIRDICYQMGNGMADFAEKKVESIEDYDLYCHYVAGLVGHGLSGLFAVSGYEDSSLKDQQAISNSMGLFLQKTNIIRDYHEDLVGGRSFWPKEIWGAYSDELTYFRDHAQSRKSLACLNHMVTDALRHVPDCITYLRKLNNKQVFRFCAIPQVMAIATLAKVYNNPDVFTSNVKIRKGLAAKLMVYTNDMASIQAAFRKFTFEILDKVDRSDPNYRMTLQYLENISVAMSEPNIKPASSRKKMLKPVS